MLGRIHKPFLLALAALLLSACGGGSGGGDSGGAAPTAAVGWTPGVFVPAANFAGQCAALTQNNWLRSWTNDLYLWYDEVVDRDPALSTTRCSSHGASNEVAPTHSSACT